MPHAQLVLVHIKYNNLLLITRQDQVVEACMVDLKVNIHLIHQLDGSRKHMIKSCFCRICVLLFFKTKQN